MSTTFPVFSEAFYTALTDKEVIFEQKTIQRHFIDYSGLKAYYTDCVYSWNSNGRKLTLDFPGIEYRTLSFFCGASEIGHMDQGVTGRWKLSDKQLKSLLAKKIAYAHVRFQRDDRLLVYGHIADQATAQRIFPILKEFGFQEMGKQHINSNSGNPVRCAVVTTGNYAKLHKLVKENGFAV